MMATTGKQTESGIRTDGRKSRAAMQKGKHDIFMMADGGWCLCREPAHGALLRLISGGELEVWRCKSGSWVLSPR